MKKEKIIRAYSIRTNGETSYIMESGDKTPVVLCTGNADLEPAISAGLLRDLAMWAIQQAEEIEARAGSHIPSREPFGKYRAEIVTVPA